MLAGGLALQGFNTCLGLGDGKTYFSVLGSFNFSWKGSQIDMGSWKKKRRRKATFSAIGLKYLRTDYIKSIEKNIKSGEWLDWYTM